MKVKAYNGDRLCDAMAGVDYSHSTPHILRCTNKAEFEFTATHGKRFIRAWVCADCLERMKKQYANED
jgi:ribosomal protein L28